MAIEKECPIVNCEQSEYQIVTPEMNVSTACIVARIEGFFHYLIRRAACEQNQFRGFRDTAENVKMYPLCATQGITVKEEYMPEPQSSAKQRKRIDKYQGRKPRQAKQPTKKTNFGEIMQKQSED